MCIKMLMIVDLNWIELDQSQCDVVSDDSQKWIPQWLQANIWRQVMASFIQLQCSSCSCSCSCSCRRNTIFVVHSHDSWLMSDVGLMFWLLCHLFLCHLRTGTISAREELKGIKFNVTPTSLSRCWLLVSCELNWWDSRWTGHFYYLLFISRKNGHKSKNHLIIFDLWPLYWAQQHRQCKNECHLSIFIILIECPYWDFNLLCWLSESTDWVEIATKWTDKWRDLGQQLILSLSLSISDLFSSLCASHLPLFAISSETVSSTTNYDNMYLYVSSSRCFFSSCYVSSVVCEFKWMM